MTPKSISKLPIGTHPMPAYPGLRMVVSATCRSWSYRFRDGRNKLKQTKLGEWPGMSLAGAVTAWEGARQQKALPAKVTHTVKEIVDAYCVEHLQVRRKHPSNRVDMLYRHLGDLWNRDAASVGRTDAAALLSGLKAKPAVQRLMRVELAACWNHAIDTGRLLVETNPWSRQRVAPVGKRQRVLNEGELTAWLRWLPTSSLTVTMRDVAMLVLLTGARAGEVCSMRWADVDLDGGTWQLRAEATKSGIGRTVQLSGPASNVLSSRADVAGGGGEWVFPNRNGKGPIKQAIYSNALWHARETCPVQGWTGHDLRRQCRSGLAMLGCPDPVAEAVLGHSIPGIVGVYQVYSYAREQKHWLEKWGRHLKGLT